jgi:non-ribosomal peptide synthetase component F
MAALPVTWTGPDVVAVAVGLSEADGEYLVVIPAAGVEDSEALIGATVALIGTTVVLTTGMVTVPLLVTE